MAAQDTFDSFNLSLSEVERRKIAEFIKNETRELLMARSEDARVRLVQEYIRQTNILLGESK